VVVSISKRHHDEYLAQLGAGALRRRAESLYQELEVLQQLRRQAKRDLVVECGKYPEAKLLCSVPFLGPVRAAVLIGRVQTPHRFRTKRQFWAYCGLALETRDSGEYRMVNGPVERRKRPAQIRGLNWNHNRELKNLFKAAATSAAACKAVFHEFYLGLLKKNMQPETARLTLARRGTFEVTSSLSAWSPVGDRRYRGIQRQLSARVRGSVSMPGLDHAFVSRRLHTFSDHFIRISDVGSAVTLSWDSLANRKTFSDCNLK